MIMRYATAWYVRVGWSCTELERGELSSLGWDA